MLDFKAYPLSPNAPEMQTLLQRTRNGDADAPGKLVDYFVARLNKLRQNSLFPLGSQQGSQVQAHTILAQNLDAARQWNQLATDLTASAYHLWCDTASDIEQHLRESRDLAVEAAQRTQVQYLAHYARLLLLMALEAKLYVVRSGFNYLFFAPRAGQSRRKTASSTFTKYVREYFSTLKNWDKQLHSVTRVHYFPLDRTDVERLRVLGKQFGPGQVEPLEHGWFSQMDEAKDTLWYEYNRSLKSIRRDLHEWGGYFLLVLANIFSGYGVRPWRYLWASGGVFVALVALFFADDFLWGGAACSQSASTLSWDNISGYLMAALSSLAGHTVGTHPCGPATALLTNLGSFGGYFLLAVLASLLFQLLNPDEQ